MKFDKRETARGIFYEFAYEGQEMNHPSHWTHFDEQSVRDSLWGILPGDEILDVGAAYGSYSLAALAHGASKIWAWSPQGVPGETTEKSMFEKSLSLNEWADKCTVYGDHGMYSRDGWLDTMTQQFWEEQPELNPNIIRVEKLDTWGRKVRPSKIDWMKMDVEGAEIDVLNGGASLIRLHKPKILIENHVFKRDTLEKEVRDLVESFGYSHSQTIPYHSVSHSLFIPI